MSVSAFADVYDTPQLEPILNRLHPSTHELNLKVGYFPVGGFNKHMGFGGSYTQFITPNHGWEVLSGYFVSEQESELKQTLIQYWNAKEEDFAVLSYLVKTGYTYAPFYTKSIFFNRFMVHSKSYVNASAGIADLKIETAPFVSVGLAQNFYFAENWGVKFEFDYFNFFKQSEYIQNHINIGVGIVYSWGEMEL